MKYFLIFLLFSQAAWSSEIILDRINHLGVRKVDLLRHKSGAFYFDGKNLGSRLPPNVMQSWSEIEKAPDVLKRSSACSAGSFVLTAKKGQKQKSVRGCTEGKAYGRLIHHVEVVRSYAQGI